MPWSSRNDRKSNSIRGGGDSEAQRLATKALGPEINPWYQKARRHEPVTPAFWVGVEGTERGRSPGLTGQLCLNRYFQPVRDPVSKKETWTETDKRYPGPTSYTHKHVSTHVITHMKEPVHTSKYTHTYMIIIRTILKIFLK